MVAFGLQNGDVTEISTFYRGADGSTAFKSGFEKGSLTNTRSNGIPLTVEKDTWKMVSSIFDVENKMFKNVAKRSFNHKDPARVIKTGGKHKFASIF